MASFINGKLVVRGEVYMHNGRQVFVNPETNLLEEGEEFKHWYEERVAFSLTGRLYKRKGELALNGHKVQFDPSKETFNEVEESGDGSYKPVGVLQPY